MAKTGYNPQKLSAKILSKMPAGARLLRDEEERKAFLVESACKPDLYIWRLRRWEFGCYGRDPTSTYCTVRPLNWDKPAEQSKDQPIHVIEAATVQVPTEREWFIPVIDFAGVGNFWTAYNPRSTLEEAQYVIINARPPGPSLACILRVKLPCRQ